MQAIRILQVLASGAVGGGATHLRSLVERMPRDRFDVHVACSADGPLAGELGSLGVPVWPVDLRGRMNLGSAPRLAALARELGTHAVHFHGTRAGLPGGLAARLSGAQGVYTVHGWACHPRRSRVLEIASRRIERAIVRLCDRVICVSQGDLETGLALGLLGPEKASVIPNGVDTSQFQEAPDRERAREALGLEPWDVSIGLVGRLTRQKGQEVLLRAAPLVLDEVPASRFLLVGDGEDRDRLEALAERLDLRSRVRFLGTRRDVPALMRALDVFVLPSHWEGMPISLLEAMAAGLPVVASNVTGSREAVVDGVSGLLVPAGSHADLAAALVRVAGDPQFAARLGAAARERVAARYGVDAMVAATAAVYEDLVASGPHGSARALGGGAAG